MRIGSMKRRIAFFAVCFFLVIAAPSRAQTVRRKLVVGIVIDQFRYDYLERFADLFGEDGFQRLMREAAVFSDAQYLHSITVTAPESYRTSGTSAPKAHHGTGWSYDTNVPVIL